ncbi:MAG: anthranilate synthase component I family protein [Desulfovibrio sp.]|nr:anthranilate synthase component I family protein [Desulfovibrio sp.]
MASASSEPLHLKQTVRWLEADTETPISLYLKLAGSGDGILLESAEVDGRWGRYSVLACDMLFFISCRQGNAWFDIRDERFASLASHNGKPWLAGVRAAMAAITIEQPDEELPPITRALYGYLGFGMAAIFNPHLQKVMPAQDSESVLALPANVFVFDHLYNRLCQLSISGQDALPDGNLRQPGASDYVHIDTDRIEARPDGEGYKRFVAEIRERLRKGEAIQIVPSVRFCAPFEGDPFLLYRRMRRFNASPYMFYMRFPEITLFGASPEVMVRCTRDKLELSPIAGTRRRGATREEDERLAAELLRDPKDCAEHVMLVDLGRNDLGRVAQPGSVKVDKFMQVQRFSHVMHMTSDVTATLRQTAASGHELDALDVLAAAFPAGTVSGAPKFRAMEIIRELEGQDRGPYAGCIGWIGLDKDAVNMDMGIAIRSMWVRDGRICWQAGGGIVHDSDPELEWQEVCNKSAIMRLALGLEEGRNVPAHR